MSIERRLKFKNHPHPNPLPRVRGRGSQPRSVLLLLILFVMLALSGCGKGSSSSASTPAPTSATTPPPGLSKYNYLAADGGPHMLLPAEAASSWSGAPSMAAATNPKSDYGRACAAVAVAQMGVIPVGGTSAVVFNDPPMTAWGTSADGMIEVYYLKQWTSMNLDALVTKATAALPTASMTDSGNVLQFKEPGAYLLFAGDTPNSTAYGVHRLPVQPGKYKLLVGTYTMPGETVTVYRLKSTD
jgi:hypothetical protein